MHLFAAPQAASIGPLRASRSLVGGVERAALLPCLGAVLFTGAACWATGRAEGPWWLAFLCSLVVAFLLLPMALVSWRHAQGRSVFFAPATQARLQAATDLVLDAVLSDLARDPTTAPSTACEMSWSADGEGLHLQEVFAVDRTGTFCQRSWGDKMRRPPLLTLPWSNGDAPRRLSPVRAPVLDLTVDLPPASGHRRLPLAAKALAASQALGVPPLDLMGLRSS